MSESDMSLYNQADQIDSIGYRVAVRYRQYRTAGQPDISAALSVLHCQCHDVMMQ